MSFEARRDNTGTRTGIGPAEFERLARARGYSPATKATEVTDWLKAEYGLGRGHAMAIVRLLKERGVLK